MPLEGAWKSKSRVRQRRHATRSVLLLILTSDTPTQVRVIGQQAGGELHCFYTLDAGIGFQGATPYFRFRARPHQHPPKVNTMRSPWTTL